MTHSLVCLIAAASLAALTVACGSEQSNSTAAETQGAREERGQSIRCIGHSRLNNFDVTYSLRYRRAWGARQNLVLEVSAVNAEKPMEQKVHDWGRYEIKERVKFGTFKFNEKFSLRFASLRNDQDDVTLIHTPTVKSDGTLGQTLQAKLECQKDE